MAGAAFAGVYAERIEDKVRSGIPDIYVDGGRWIECKFRVMVVRGRGINVLQFFSAAQKLRLARRGCRDENLAAFLFCNPAGETAFFMVRFLELYTRPDADGPEDRCLWNFPRARQWGVPLSDAALYVKAVLGDPWQGVRSHLQLDPEWPASKVMENTRAERMKAAAFNSALYRDG